MRELRLELMRVQIQNQELKMLLDAEDAGNKEAAEAKLVDYQSKV